MDSDRLFVRFQDAVQEADRLRARRARGQPRARRFALQRVPIGRDIPEIAAATFRRRQDAAESAGRLDDHVTAHLRAVTALRFRLDRGEGLIELGPYLRQVCQELPSPDYQDPNVRLEIDAESIELDADRALRLGLITAELAMNAHQHAFGTPRGGTIRISARGYGAVLASFAVADTGRGFPQSFKRGYGLLSVEALANAIGGEVGYSEGASAAVLLTFSGGYLPPDEFYGLPTPA